MGSELLILPLSVEEAAHRYSGTSERLGLLYFLNYIYPCCRGAEVLRFRRVREFQDHFFLVKFYMTFRFRKQNLILTCLPGQCQSHGRKYGFLKMALVLSGRV